MNLFDFLQDSDGDLLISRGDLKIGDSDKRSIADIIIAFPGWWKQYPQVGVGAQMYVGSAGKQQELARSIRIQLEADGFSLQNPVITFDQNGKMSINPNAQRL